MLNYAPRLEDLCVLNLSIRWKWVVSFNCH